MAVSQRLVLLAALVALPGCQLTIPNGLLDNLQRATPTGVKGEPATPKTTEPSPAKPPVVEPIGGKPVQPPGGLTGGPPPVGPMIGRPAGPPIGKLGGPFGSCDENFARLDADQDGGLDFGELARWEALEQSSATTAMRPDCTRTAPAPMPPTSEPPPMGLSEEAWVASNNPGAVPFDAPDQPMPGCASLPRIDALGAFGKFDWNQDKRLDRKEFCAFSDAWTAPPGGQPGPDYPPPPDTDCKASFVNADANGDGAVTIEEYLLADYHGRDGLSPDTATTGMMPPDSDMKARFFARDHDQNGQLDPGEWCADKPDPPPPPPTDPPELGCADEAADTNRDGLVDWGEFFEAHRHEADVMAVDYAIAKEQIYKRFAELDHNDDGFLDAAERCQG